MRILQKVKKALKLAYDDPDEEREYLRLKLPLDKEYHKVTRSNPFAFLHPIVLDDMLVYFISHLYLAIYCQAYLSTSLYRNWNISLGITASIIEKQNR